eukprot:5371826-Pyramimonas_sp.AAC.1
MPLDIRGLIGRHSVAMSPASAWRGLRRAAVASPDVGSTAVRSSRRILRWGRVPSAAIMQDGHPRTRLEGRRR